MTPTPSMSNQRYFRVREVAQRFNVSVPTIWRWAKVLDDFPAPVRVGPGVSRWRDEDLQRFELGLAAKTHV